MKSPSLTELYYEIMDEVPYEDDEEIIEELTARFGAPFQIINDEIIYRNGAFTHEEVMRILRGYEGR